VKNVTCGGGPDPNAGRGRRHGEAGGEGASRVISMGRWGIGTCKGKGRGLHPSIPPNGENGRAQRGKKDT